MSDFLRRLNNLLKLLLNF